MPRKNRFSTFEEAAARGAYDEFPMLEIGIDPQLHLSRNAIAQPFFLICEQDTMIAQLSGAARIEFRHAAVNYFDAEIGDFVYVPGGTPHRIVKPKSRIRSSFATRPTKPRLRSGRVVCGQFGSGRSAASPGIAPTSCRKRRISAPAALSMPTPRCVAVPPPGSNCRRSI